MASNPSRERVLERIRAGLRAPVKNAPQQTPVLDDVFEPVLNPLERFQTEATANLMECRRTRNPSESAAQLAEVLRSLPEGEIFVQESPVLRQLMQESAVQRPVRWSGEGAPRESSQATITVAESLVAQTGSVFVTAACGGRGASVIAPCHIVFATTDQIVPDLYAALSQAQQQGRFTQASYGCMISGSSRTADIEKILVQGAHGPRRLVVILQETA
ncbi:MAG TPA: LUD domain-containing protein [Terriglobales bacterium]|nr:LUD domain-containing protein [Terriglobales bacterium]